MDLEKQQRILAVENQAIDLRLPDRILLRRQDKRSSFLSLADEKDAS
jgi:hypothetical protein